MSVYVLLTDNDSDMTLVCCEDLEAAKRVGSAAVFSDGGVSAWMLPSVAIDAGPNLAELLLILRDGGTCVDLDRIPTIDVAFKGEH